MSIQDAYERKKFRLAIYDRILELKPLYDDLSKKSHYGTLQENSLRGQTRPERMLKDATGRDVYIYDIEPSLYPNFVNAEHQQLALDCLLPPDDMSSSFSFSLTYEAISARKSPYENLERFIKQLMNNDPSSNFTDRILNNPQLLEHTKHRINSLITSLASDYLMLTDEARREDASASLRVIFQESHQKEEIKQLAKYLRDGLIAGIKDLILQQLQNSREFASRLMCLDYADGDDKTQFIYEALILHNHIIAFQNNTKQLLLLLKEVNFDEDKLLELEKCTSDLALHAKITSLCADIMPKYGIEKLPEGIPQDCEFRLEVEKKLHHGTLGIKSSPNQELIGIKQALDNIRQNVTSSINNNLSNISLDIVFLFTASVGIAAIALAFTVLAAGLPASIALAIGGGVICAFSLFGMRETGYKKGVVDQATQTLSLVPGSE